MKNLLHSKRLRKNLFKWVIMYVCVMFLFTTVVTYSKYISQMNADEKLTVAKFNVAIGFESGKCANITNTSNADGTDSKACVTDNYRPTSEIPYYFYVDTRELEVDNVFDLFVQIHSDFVINDLINESTGEKIIYDGKVVNNAKYQVNSSSDGSSYHILYDILKGEGKRDNYFISVKYRDLNKLPDISKVQRIVTVGYSATQITN